MRLRVMQSMFEIYVRLTQGLGLLAELQTPLNGDDTNNDICGQLRLVHTLACHMNVILPGSTCRLLAGDLIVVCRTTPGML